MGIWISEPALQPNGNYLVVVDSEGTETGNTSQQPKILALVILALSVPFLVPPFFLLSFFLMLFKFLNVW